MLANAVLVLGCAFIAGGLRHGTAALRPGGAAAERLPPVARRRRPARPDPGRPSCTPLPLLTPALSDACAIVFWWCTPPAFPSSCGTGGQPGPEDSAEAGEQTAGWPLRPVRRCPGSKQPGRRPGIRLVRLRAATGRQQPGLVGDVHRPRGGRHRLQRRRARWWASASPSRPSREYAISTTLNSPLQVALLLTPILVLLSRFGGSDPAHPGLSPLLVAALGVSVAAVALIIYDGEYTWIEGVALVALYCIVATAFWWG